MFVERKAHYSSLFTNLVSWHTSVVSLPLTDVILAQLACPLSYVIFCLHSGITNLSLYKHWAHVHRQHLFPIIPAKEARDSTCLGHLGWHEQRHLSNIDFLKTRTTCLVCFISTINGHRKKRKRSHERLALEVGT